MELEDGKIIVMGPSDVYSSEISARLIWLLMNWISPRSLGRVFDSRGGFILQIQISKHQMSRLFHLNV